MLLTDAFQNTFVFEAMVRLKACPETRIENPWKPEPNLCIVFEKKGELDEMNAGAKQSWLVS